jgi:hypothetical protein
MIRAMTRTMHAWRKANACIRSGQHRKAIYWLSRMQEILSGPPPRRQHDSAAITYLFGAAAVLVVVCIAMR